MLPIREYQKKEDALRAWLAEHVTEARVLRAHADVLDRGAEVATAVVRFRTQKRECRFSWHSYRYAFVECGIGALDAEFYEFTPTDPRQSAVARLIITGDRP